MYEWFEFKGQRCTAFGIRVSKAPPILRPLERAQRIQLPGRSGSLSLLEGEDVFEDFLLSMECVLPDVSKLSEVNAWLKGNGDLRLPHRPQGVYKAVVANQISFEQVLRGNPHRSFIVIFRCQPFLHLTGIPDIVLTTSGSRINNLGTVPAFPIIKLEGSGDIRLMVDQTITAIQGLPRPILLDSQVGLATNLTRTINMSALVSGDWPKLGTGRPAVSWQGNVTRITITPNWCLL